MMSVGDIMSTEGGVQCSGEYHKYAGGYHDECEEISMIMISPSALNTLHCTHDVPPLHS